MAAQQGESASVRGFVEAEGRAVPGARLWLEPADTAGTNLPNRAGHGIRIEADRRGRFFAVGIAPGLYRVSVVSKGSTDGVSGPLELEPGAAVEAVLDETGKDGIFVLHVLPGPAAEPTAMSRPGDLPLEDRQWEAVQATEAAAHETTSAGGGAAQDAGEEDTAPSRAGRETGSAATGLSVAGLPATQDAETVDGLSADQAFRSGPRGAAAGGPRLRSGFAEGAVRSVRVMPHTFSARYGGGAGAVVTVRSREAAAAGVHGSAFFEERSSAWAATNPFAVVSRYEDGAITSSLERPSDRDLQFGGAAGATVLRRGRVGIFGAMEGQRREQTVISAPQTAGFFTLSTEQTALLATRGVGTAAVRAALDYLSDLGGPTSVTAPRELGFVRLNTQPGRSDRVDGTAQVQRQSAPSLVGAGYAEGIVGEAISSIGRSRVADEALGAGWEHRFGGRAVNSVRVQWIHDLEYEAPPAVQSAAVPAIGPGGYAPEVLIEPEGFRYGTPASLGRIAYPDERRIEVAEALEFRLGRHLLAVGGDWSRVGDRALSVLNQEGSFLYDSGTTGGYDGGLVDWITDYTFNVHAYPNGGCPSVYAEVHYFCFRSYTQGFAGSGAATVFATHNVAGFAEDSVRLGRQFLFSLGARYEYLLLPFPQAPNPALDLLLRQVGGPAMGLTSSFPEDRNDVAPRASLAWSPRREGRHGSGMLVTAGYGFFYGRLPGATIQAALADTALPTAAQSTESIRILPTTETGCPQVANQGFGYPCTFLAAPTGVVAQTGSAAVFAARFRLPAVQRGSFAVQGSVGRHVLWEGTYATAWAMQLPASVDLNIAPSTATATYVIQGGEGHPGLRTGEVFQVPRYTQRVTTLYGPVTAIESNANATFHAGTATAALREWHGWSVRGSYAFARAIDYGPQSSPTPRQNGQFDPFTDGYEKGLSDLQFAHHFAGVLTARSEVRSGSRLMQGVAGGWRVAAIATAGSGAPYSYVIFGGTRLNGGHESINGSGGASYLPTVGRNTLRLPARGKVDLRAAREVPLGGRWHVEVRADAFNLLNSVSLSRVETRAFLLGTPASGGAPTPLIFQDAATVAAEGISTPAFGTALSSTSALSRERQVALGARLSF